MLILAIRTQRRLKIAAISILIYCVIALLAAIFSPFNGLSFGDSVLRWLIGIPIYAVIWLVLEWGGTNFFGLPFWTWMSSLARIVMTVILVAVIVVVWIAIKNWIGN